MALVKQNLHEVLRDSRPWEVRRLARFGDLQLDVYLCEGVLASHRHPEQDELFLVHSGSMVLNTSRGDLNLRSEELAVVPKGMAHQSGAALPATVLLFRVAEEAAMRRDGRWRLFATDADPAPRKINLGSLYLGLERPYQPLEVTRYEGWTLWLARCVGSGPAMEAGQYGMPLVVMRGMLALVTAQGDHIAARQGDVMLVPPGTRFHLATDTAAMLLSLTP